MPVVADFVGLRIAALRSAREWELATGRAKKPRPTNTILEEIIAEARAADETKRARQRASRQPKSSIKQAAHRAAEILLHPERVAARFKLQWAVRSGKIHKPLACSKCERPTEKRFLHGHHHDYAKPLEVEWLCAGCHLGWAHRHEVAGHE